MARKKGLTISKVRGALYTTAKVLGDIQAVTHKNPGKAIPKRLARRIVGKATGRFLGWLIR